MFRSKLKNKANKTNTTHGSRAYKKQHNYVVLLNKESKHNYFDTLDTKKGAKPFCNVCNCYFLITSILVIEKGELILSEMKIITTEAATRCAL